MLASFLFYMQRSLSLKIQSISLLKTKCEDVSLRAEVKYHIVWKLIVSGLVYFQKECVFILQIYT